MEFCPDDAARVAAVAAAGVTVEADAAQRARDLGEADAGVVALCDEPREQVEPAVWTVPARRVEDALGFLRTALLRDHHGADPRQAVRHLKRVHPGSFPVSP